MFNTQNHESKVVAINKETIIEKSISPDKIVDMYNEVRKAITFQYVNKDNSFELVVFKIQNGMDYFGTQLLLGYNLNWTYNEHKLSIPMTLENHSGKQILIRDICDAIAKDISEMLLKDIIKLC